MAAWANTLSAHNITPANNSLTSGTWAKGVAGPLIQRCTRAQVRLSSGLTVLDLAQGNASSAALSVF